MMGSRRGKGDLKVGLAGGSSSKKITSEKSAVASLNQGRGQEITGVTMPTPGTVKGWGFGDRKSVACANVDGEFYAIQGECPRCAFDLFKGDIINDEGFTDLPRIACPTCSTTYSMKSGVHGPPVKRTGLAGFVGNLAKTATINDASSNAVAFSISIDDESGRVFMKEK
eukprot:CAMPEP_0197236294 /NCGR_PEP_ID=MMETSP1429-20130617/3451_1 /TAXON_ID=49237 /ORGANISM="Chaetoceros  sp., Strain UNC1202" /LENGTH=168 /DNA_ID=CAMNT_0042695049 /DNA_START=92 /DNA_END=598 /DNA_ORIENTATION=-